MLKDFSIAGRRGFWSPRKLRNLTSGSRRRTRVPFEPTTVTGTPFRNNPLAKPTSYSPWNAVDIKYTRRMAYKARQSPQEVLRLLGSGSGVCAFKSFLLRYR